MTKNQTKEFIKQKINKDAIVRQAESLLAMLLSKDTSKKEAISHKSEVESVSTSVNSREKRKNSRIPRKRIDCTFSEEDYDCYKLFYGSVHLQWEVEKKTTGVQYKLLLRSKANMKLLCKLIVSEKVYEYIAKAYKSPMDFNCKVVFIAFFSSSKVKKSYHTTVLKYGQWLCLEKE